MKLFKILGKKLGLQLRSNEREELEAIDKELRDLPLNVGGFLPIDLYQELLQYRREQTVEAYTLMHATQQALNTAQSSNGTQDQWLEALRRAQEADKLMQPLIEAKFHDLVSPKMGLLPLLTFGTCFNTLMLGSTIGVIALSRLLRAINMTPEEIETTVSYYTILLLAPLLLGVLLDGHRTEITRLLSSTMTEYVLDAAKRANVTLDPAHIIVIKELNQQSNAQILEKMGVSDVPDRFYCPISYQILDNPTFSKQHLARFDRKSIHDWLKVTAVPLKK